jgi:hypothetical protein
MRTTADFESLHRYSSNNRELLAKSEAAGCFYCGAMFSASEIKDWVDGKQLNTGGLETGVTALCPRCGIDSVLPAAAPINLTQSLLAEMHDHWF